MLVNLVVCMILQAEFITREGGKPGMSDVEVCFFFLALYLLYCFTFFCFMKDSNSRTLADLRKNIFISFGRTFYLF